MLELILSVCLLADPSRCKDVMLTGDDVASATPYGCLRAGPPESAKWIEANPKWSFRRWSCRPAGRMAKA